MHGAMPPDTEGQCAYIPNRSGNLCVAIQLQDAEACPNPTLNGEWDQVKAFDSGRWEPVILEYEKELGCGSFLYEYLQGQTYEYIYDVSGKSRMGFAEEPRGRGFWPGGTWAPHLFTCFQGTNTWINKSEDVWLSPGKFSDDASPIADWNRVLNGDVARQLGGVYQWSKEQHIDFHLSGKKAPKYYIYRKSSDPVGDYHTCLKFGETEFIREYEKRQLGIKVCFFKDDEKANKYGYYLDWVGKRPLSSVSNRLQELRYIWDTKTLRASTQAYVVGKLQFAASLHWLRASERSIARARFDYAMALAACVGATTPEIVGMFNCKSKRVSKTNKKFIELCRYLDLPTLEEMAIKDSRSLIKQWSLYDPQKFLWHIPFRPLGQEWVEAHYGTDVPEGSLLDELYALSKRDIVDRYPLYHHKKRTGSLHRLPFAEQIEISPDYLKDLQMSKDATNDVWNQMNLGQPDSREIANTFWLMVREKFNVLERYPRLCQNLPVPALSRQEKRPNDTETSASKKIRFSISDCSSGTPWRRATHSKELEICRVCGYYIEFKNCIKMSCCHLKVHRNCVRNQPSSCESSSYRCRDLSAYMKRGGRAIDIAVTFSKPPSLNADQVRARRVLNLKDRLICAVCETQIESADPVLLRNHLIKECKSVPTALPLSNDKYELSRRLAALSSIYRVNDGVRIRQRLVPLEQPPDPPDPEILSEGSGGRHTPSFGLISSASQ